MQALLSIQPSFCLATPLRVKHVFHPQHLSLYSQHTIHSLPTQLQPSETRVSTVEQHLSSCINRSHDCIILLTSAISYHTFRFAPPRCLMLYLPVLNRHPLCRRRPRVQHSSSGLLSHIFGVYRNHIASRKALCFVFCYALSCLMSSGCRDDQDLLFMRPILILILSPSISLMKSRSDPNIAMMVPKRTSLSSPSCVHEDEWRDERLLGGQLQSFASWWNQLPEMPSPYIKLKGCSLLW